MSPIPQRIVCLSAEVADWFWRLGAWDNVAGVTAYFQPPKNLSPKPRVSGFSTANLTEIKKLKPDLIITFSDVQRKLAEELTRRGFAVLPTDPRTLAEIETTLFRLAQIVGREPEAKKLLHTFCDGLAPVTAEYRPRVYFEEWNEPLISGITWVSELIERAGGQDIFPELKTKRAAMERIITAEQVCAANPEIIFASWCGQPVDTAEIAARPGWSGLAAVQSHHLFEISGEDILQPGFRLLYGFKQLRRIIQNWPVITQK